VATVEADNAYICFVYRRLVARQVTSIFASLSRGDHDRVIAALAPDVHHSFAGDHSLGGERHGKESVAAWFGRLARLCPEMRFAVRQVVSPILDAPSRKVLGRSFSLRAEVEVA
jgi:hypothetical protein